MFVMKYIKIVWGALLFAGGVAVSMLASTSVKNRKEKKRIQRQYERAKEVMDQDVVIDRQADVRTEEIKDEIKKKRSTSELSDPNKW